MEAGSEACRRPVAAGDSFMPWRYQIGRNLRQGARGMSVRNT